MNAFNSFRSLTFGAGRIFAALVGVLWLGTPALRAADYYVRPSATCTNSDLQSPYTTWDIAATNIQWAVNVAMTNVPATVWVSNGTYCLTNQITITNNITVQSTNGYSNTLVYAGWPTYTTRCFYVSRTGVVDGFTISNGHYMGSNNYSGGGGAFVTSSGRIQNCYFRNNICSNDGVYTGGGGVYITTGVVSDCIFFTNVCYKGPSGSSQVNGGGVCIENGGTIMGCTIISNCLISGNVGSGIAVHLQGLASNCFIAYNVGGNYALFLYSPDTYPSSDAGPGAVNCIISNNSAGVWNQMGWMRDCLIINNQGRGVFLQRAGNLTNCVIVGNRGGGVYSWLATPDSWPPYLSWYPTVDNCVISNNLCSAGLGGGVYIDQATVLRNCLIANNTNTFASGYGGGIYLTNAAAYSRGTSGVFNCTIVNNYSTNEGGGICAVGLTNYIVNCIVAGNSSSSGNYPNVYNRNAENSNNYYNCCAVTAAPSVFAPNQGNITNDPRFVNASAGNWRLANNSPCINTGTNQNWMTNLYDHDGRTRIRYGIVDMGAYEKINEATVYNVR